MSKKRDWITILFYLLYVAVAAATFRHSAIGFASIEGGSVMWGVLSALAVDAGMMLSASGLRKARTKPLVIGLVISAVASTYTQLLFAMSHAGAVTVAPGAEWMSDFARTIIDVRVLALPALLPSLSVVYAFSAKSGGVVHTPRVASKADWRTISATLDGARATIDADGVAAALDKAGVAAPSVRTMQGWAKETKRKR
jgi:hypothetical protein